MDEVTCERTGSVFMVNFGGAGIGFDASKGDITELGNIAVDDLVDQTGANREKTRSVLNAEIASYLEERGG